MTMIKLTIAAACVGIVGCGSQRVEQEHGASVRQMIEAQTYDPGTLTNPSATPPVGADPDMVNAALGVLRESVSHPQEVSRPITIDVGGQGR